MAGLGKAWQSRCGPAWHGGARCGSAWLGKAGGVSLGAVSQRPFRLGMAVAVRLRASRQVWARQGSQG